MRSWLAGLFLVFLAWPAAAQILDLTPPGYTALMEREPELAYPGRERWAVDMDLLRRVNDRVNRAPYAPDGDADRWGAGSDCEDYAVLKMATLMHLGVPRGAMRLAVVDLWGRKHAVLIVGYVHVLDSLTPEIYHVATYPGAFVATEGVGGWLRASRSVGLRDALR